MVYYVNNEEFLAHHGILGQKWGVRRFQNEDGSLTEAGKKRYSKYLYSEMKKNEGKLNRSDYGRYIKDKISGDKRVKDYVSKNAEGYKKLFNEWADLEDKIDAKRESDDVYKRAYEKAIKNGGDPKAKYFDEYVFELMGSDKEIAKLESQSDEAWNKINEYSKRSKPLVEDILGKYLNSPANAINDSNVKAEYWVYSALEDLMHEHK